MRFHSRFVREDYATVAVLHSMISNTSKTKNHTSCGHQFGIIGAILVTKSTNACPDVILSPLRWGSHRRVIRKNQPTTSQLIQMLCLCSSVLEPLASVFIHSPQIILSRINYQHAKYIIIISIVHTIYNINNILYIQYTRLRLQTLAQIVHAS